MTDGKLRDLPPGTFVKAVAYFDGGGQAPGPIVAAAHVEGPGITAAHEAVTFPEGTHNVAEWEALALTLRLALRQGATHPTVRGDSALIIGQARGDFQVKAPHLKPLYAEAMKLVAEFEHVAFEWVPGEQNTRADELGRTPR